jgi:hypothetical protein
VFPFLFTTDYKFYMENPATKNMNEEDYATLFAANYHGLVSYVLGGPLRTPGMPSLNVLFPLDCAPASPEYSHEILFPDKFLTELHRGAKCNVAHALAKKSYYMNNGRTDKRIIRVCAHVRHGDLEDTRLKPTMRMPRITLDIAWFILFDAISDAVERILPEAVVDMHAFTSCSGAFNDSYCAEYAASLGARYKAHNVSLHMDFESNVANATSDAMVAWAHFISADVLVTSKSSFSMTPAFFNRRCVVYQAHWNAPLPHWISADVSSDLSQLQKLMNVSVIADQLALSLPSCLSKN